MQEVVEEDFDFDAIDIDTQEELAAYMEKCRYEIGEPCGFWGDDVGILKEICYGEE